MSLACKCDRCGKYFEPDNLNFVDRVSISRKCLVNHDKTKFVDHWELCTDCTKAFKNWFKEKEAK